MKTPARLLSAFAATCLAFLPFASAQLITNTSSHAGYGGSFTSFADGAGSLTQTFTNVSAVTSMTYNFFASSGGTTGATFSATFGQWNGSSFVEGTTASFSNFTVGDSGGWPNQAIGNATSRPTSTVAFDLTTLSGAHETFGYLTDSSLTYAMQLTYLSGGDASTIGLGRNTTNPFSFGGAYNDGANVDYVFSQMAVYQGNQQLVPIPETSTVAAIAGAVLVAGLVIIRTRQRRQLALIPAPATTA